MPGDYFAWALTMVLLAEGHLFVDLVPPATERDPVLEVASERKKQQILGALKEATEQAFEGVVAGLEVVLRLW